MNRGWTGSRDHALPYGLGETPAFRSENFRKVIGQNRVPSHIGHNEFFVFGVQGHSPRLLDQAFRPANFPARRNIPVVVNAPNADKRIFRLGNRHLGRLRRDDPPPWRINLKLLGNKETCLGSLDYGARLYISAVGTIKDEKPPLTRPGFRPSGAPALLSYRSHPPESLWFCKARHQ